MVFSFAKIIIMFVPVLSVIITCKSIHLKSHGIHLKVNIKANWKYLLLAVWAPILLTVFGAILYFLIFSNTFSSELPYISEKLKLMEQVK